MLRLRRIAGHAVATCRAVALATSTTMAAEIAGAGGCTSMGRATERLQASAAAAVLIAGFAAAAAINWPGHINWDAAVQLAEGRAGQYQNWHPAIMSWMLSLGDAVVPGVSLFVLFDTLVLYGAELSLLWLAKRPHWSAACVALLWVATPQFAIYPGMAVKDVLFTAAGVASFICLAHAAVRWPRQWLRLALLGGAIAFAVLAAMARQNGAIVVAFAAVAIGLVAGMNGRGARLAAAYGAGALLVACAVLVLGFAALSTRFEKNYDARADQIKELRAFDLVGAVKRQPGLHLDAIRSASPAFELAIRDRGVRLYQPGNHDSLADDEAFSAALDKAPDKAVTRQWLDLVLGHPRLYLELRAETFRWLVAAPDPAICPPFEIGVYGPDDLMKRLNIDFRKDRRDVWLTAYAGRFSGTPVLSHLAYMLLGAGTLAFLLRRRRPADVAIAGLVAASLAYMASFFVISIACDYRYLLFVDVAAMTAALYIAVTWREPRGGS